MTMIKSERVSNPDKVAQQTNERDGKGQVVSSPRVEISRLGFNEGVSSLMKMRATAKA